MISTGCPAGVSSLLFRELAQDHAIARRGDDGVPTVELGVVQLRLATYAWVRRSRSCSRLITWSL